MRILVTLALLGAAAAFAPAASAAPSAAAKACVAAHATSQDLRAAGKYRAADEQLARSVQSDCPRPIAADCEQWKAEVAASLPTVLIDAQADGADVANVTVSVDGQVIATSLTGRAIALDPGPHTLAFALGERREEQSIVLREKEKDRLIHVRFTTVAKPPPPPPVIASPPPTEPPPSRPNVLAWTAPSAPSLGFDQKIRVAGYRAEDKTLTVWIIDTVAPFTITATLLDVAPMKSVPVPAPAPAADGTAWIVGAGAIAAVGPAGGQIFGHGMSAPSQTALGGDDRVYVVDGGTITIVDPHGGVDYAAAVQGIAQHVSIDGNDQLFVTSGSTLRRVRINGVGDTHVSTLLDPATEPAPASSLGEPAIGADGSVYVSDGQSLFRVADDCQPTCTQ